MNLLLDSGVSFHKPFIIGLLLTNSSLTRVQ